MDKQGMHADGRTTGEHLGDEAFAGVLTGEPPDAKTDAHLKSCAACREELARFQETVGEFSMASLAWSESRSEFWDDLRSEAGSKKKSGVRSAAADNSRAGAAKRLPMIRGLSGGTGTKWISRMPWVVAAVLLVGLAIPVTAHLEVRHGETASQGSTGNAENEDAADLNSPEQIARDNQLMAEVHEELSRSEASLIAQYGGERSASGRLREDGAEKTKMREKTQ